MTDLIKCIIIDRTKLNKENITNEDYTGDIVEIEIPTNIIIPIKSIENRVFDVVPFHYKLFKNDNLSKILRCSLMFWEVIDYYNESIGPLQLILIAECPKSWNIHDHVKYSIKYGYGNVKATYINKYHKIWNNALFCLYNPTTKKYVSMDRKYFLTYILLEAEIKCKDVISYKDVLLDGIEDTDEEKKIKLIDEIFKLEENIRNSDKKYLIEDFKPLFGTIKDYDIKMTIDNLIDIVYKHNKIYNEIKYDDLLLSELKKEFPNINTDNISRKEILDKISNPHKEEKLCVRFDEEMMEIKKNGTKSEINKLKGEHIRERRKIALNYLKYLLSRHFITLEDAYILINSQLKSQYVIKGSPWHQAGPWAHPIKELYNIMLSLSYGVGCKNNTRSETDYMFKKSSNILLPKNFDKYNDEMKKEVKKFKIEFNDPRN